MPFSELPRPTQVILFLILFVLVGIYPALKRTADKVRKLRRTAAKARQPLAVRREELHAELFARPAEGPLTDFERIVLQRFSRSSKPLSLKQVNAPLLFGRDNLHRTLRLLQRRGLIRMTVSPLTGRRFMLTEAGRRYALEQGYIVQLHEGGKRKTTQTKAA